MRKKDIEIIYVKYITRNGKRIYAKAFRLEIPRSKYHKH